MKNLFYNLIALVLGLFYLTSCQNLSKPTLKIAATSVPHAEILEQIRPAMKKRGIELEIIVMEDYHTPNRALSDQEVDANFFQHSPFLELQKKEFGYSFESLAVIHLEPMGLYSKKIASLGELQARSLVAVPSDPTNQARALCLLENQNLIKLNRRDSKASMLNITENPTGLQLIEVDSPLLCRTLEDADLAVIPANFALQAHLSPKEKALAIEDAYSLFVNILVIRTGEADRPDLQALKEELVSDRTRLFIENRYQGAVIPAF